MPGLGNRPYGPLSDNAEIGWNCFGSPYARALGVRNRRRAGRSAERPSCGACGECRLDRRRRNIAGHDGRPAPSVRPSSGWSAATWARRRPVQAFDVRPLPSWLSPRRPRRARARCPGRPRNQSPVDLISLRLHACIPMNTHVECGRMYDAPEDANRNGLSD